MIYIYISRKVAPSYLVLRLLCKLLFLLCGVAGDVQRLCICF